MAIQDINTTQTLKPNRKRTRNFTGNIKEKQVIILGKKTTVWDVTKSYKWLDENGVQIFNKNGSKKYRDKFKRCFSKAEAESTLEKFHNELKSNHYHNHSKSITYKSFEQAKERCRNPHNIGYENYGGRGIEFRFTSFQEFFDEIGERPSKEYSLDRKNPFGHYEKGNVRWATRKEQQNNKRQDYKLKMLRLVQLMVISILFEPS